MACTTGFLHYFSILKNIYDALNAEESEKFVTEMRDQVKDVADEVLKYLYDQNWNPLIGINFIYEVEPLLGVQFVLKEADDEKLKFEVQPLSTRTKSVEDEKRSIARPILYETLQSMQQIKVSDYREMRNYRLLKQICNSVLKRKGSFEGIVNVFYDCFSSLKPDNSLRKIVVESKVKHVLLPTLREAVKNSGNYTNQQLPKVIKEFVETVNALKADITSGESFERMSSASFAPFWLVTPSTTPDEFRSLCSLFGPMKLNFVPSIQAEIAKYVNAGNSHLEATLQDKLESFSPST